MDDIGVIQDYSMIDAFISQNLADFNRKLFGERDEQTGYFDEVDTEQPEEVPVEEDYSEEQVQNNEDSDEDMYASMFADDSYFGDTFQNTDFGGGDRGKPKSTLGESIASIESQGNYKATNPNSSATGKYQFLWGDWGKSIMKVTGVKSQEEFLNSPKAQEKYYSFYEKTYLLPEVQKIKKEIKTDLTDMQIAKLVHFRGEGGARKYLKGELKDKPESHNVAISKYIKRSGGVAVTPQQQYTGLNDDSMDNLFLPLEGTNPIRGLDNGEPVHVQDSIGQEQVLYGPEDIAYMTGGVYERRMQTGGDVQEEINWLNDWYKNRQSANPKLQRLIEKERKYRLENLNKPYKISNKPEDIGEGNEASYTPSKRQINIAVDAEPGTLLHEATHLSDDFSRPTYRFEAKAIKKSLPSKKQVQTELNYGDNKKDALDYFNYMSDNYEIKARLMQLRRKAGFQPGQNVTNDQLQKFFDDYEGDSDTNVDELLNFIRAGGAKDFNKKVLNLLNNTVAVQRTASNLV